jgi:hypothetical protein
MVNGTLLNFGKRYNDNLRVIFDQWPMLHLGLDALSNQRILNGFYWVSRIGQNFDDYPGFQPKITQGKHFCPECMYKVN